MHTIINEKGSTVPVVAQLYSALKGKKNRKIKAMSMTNIARYLAKYVAFCFRAIWWCSDKKCLCYVILITNRFIR